MVTGTVYQLGSTLLFDHVHRRSQTSDAIRGNEYPPQELEAHGKLTRDIEESMEAGRSLSLLLYLCIITISLPLG